MSLRYEGAVMKKVTEEKETLPEIVISGLRRSVRHFVYMTGTANFLILFKEGGIAAFTRMPANELFDQTVSADNLFLASELDLLLERLAEAATDGERVREVEAFLLH